MPSKKKKYNSRFPPARIKKIMQSDEEVGKVASAVPVIISRVLEMFVESLLKNTYQITVRRGARTLTPSHLKMCILSDGHFDFLKDLVASVPDLQGETDDPAAAASTTSLDVPAHLATSDQVPPAAAAAAVSPICGHSSPSPALFAAAAATAASRPTPASGRPSGLPRQISTARPRSRPKKASAEASAPLKDSAPKTTSCSGRGRGRRKKDRKQVNFVEADEMTVEDDEEDHGAEGPATVIALNGRGCEAEAHGSITNGQCSLKNSSHTPAHVRMGSHDAVTSAAVSRQKSPAVLQRSISYSLPVVTQPFSSGQLKFSLTYPIPLSSQPPSLPNGLAPATEAGSCSSDLITQQLSSTRGAIDEDYDA